MNNSSPLSKEPNSYGFELVRVFEVYHLHPIPCLVFATENEKEAEEYVASENKKKGLILSTNTGEHYQL